MPDANFFFAEDGIVYQFYKAEGESKSLSNKSRENVRVANIRISYPGSNPSAKLMGLEESEGKVSYFRGKDPEKWIRGASTYQKIVYESLYPEIDLVVCGDRKSIKQEYHIKKGGEVSNIKLQYEGIEHLRVNDQGQLEINTNSGTIIEDAPVSYQIIDGERMDVETGFLIGDKNTVQFKVRDYNKEHDLVIDPVLIYATYLGGSRYDESYYGEEGWGIAVDSSGNAIVTGQTKNLNFPTVPGSYDTTFNNGITSYWDAFVTKLNAAGSALIYSTFLGGESNDYGYDVEVDSSGCAYVTGYTESVQFPATWKFGKGGWSDIFVTKLNATGTAIVYSVVIGGIHDDGPYSIALDSNKNAYVAGVTWNYSSTPADHFPTTPGAYDTTYNPSDGFEGIIFKLNSNGTTLVYSTYLGSVEDERCRGIAVDSSGCAYVTGETNSPSFPVTLGAYDTTYNPTYPDNDCFVTKINAAGSGLVYSTFLGGADDENYGRDIGVDASGNAYVTGYTYSYNFPVTVGAADVTHNGYWDAFVTKLNSSGNALVFSTFLGGSFYDMAYGLSVTSNGICNITGSTWSNDFPVTPGARPYSGGARDAFMTRLNNAGTAFSLSTCLGGSEDDDEAYDIALDSSGGAYVVGYTESNNFPVTPGAFQTTLGTNKDAFVAKILYFMKNDFNIDGNEDILWRYYGPGGKNLVWYMGYSSSSSIGFEPFAQTAGQKPAVDMLQGKLPEKIYDDPREAGGLIYRKVEVKNWEMGLVEGGLILMDPTQTFMGLTELDKAMAKEGIVTMPGSKIIGSAYLNAVTDLNWQIGGAGDFNGDGWPDILWRYYGSGSIQGRNVVWYMKGATYIGSAALAAVTNLNWKIGGTGDFNGDGWPDIMWRNYGTGLNVVWYMKGATCTGSAYLNAVTNLNWKIEGTGDFNRDGCPDILWRYYGTGGIQGRNVVWYMNGVNYINSAALSAVADLNWQIGGAGDFNGDGWPDILWRNYLNGKNVVWYMKSATCLGSEYLPPTADVKWRIQNH